MLTAMIDRATSTLGKRSVTLVRWLDIELRRVVLIWVAVASFACGLRAAFPATAHPAGMPYIVTLAPYALVIVAPVFALLMAAAIFPQGALYAQPDIRLARYGRWRTLDCLSARSLPYFGASGVMASLLVGMLINIPVRTIEFLTAIPALGGDAPHWFRVLFSAMLVDVTVMTSLYAVAFVMALRHVPSFPRFLLGVWLVDLVAQVSIGFAATHMSTLPGDVAAPLATLLMGNLKKVMISLVLWMPYLILSDRVNLTYRQRVRAGA